MSIKNTPSTRRRIDLLESALWRGGLGRREFVKMAIASGVSAGAAEASAGHVAQVQSNQREKAASLKASYDFIVCGAGSSGSVVARRLADNKDVQVLLLEAGGGDDSPSILAPLQWYLNIQSERDWRYMTEPSEALNGRAIPMPMGKALGGGSSINAMVWARGHQNDFERWAKAAQDPKWGYEHVLGIYRRIEDWQGTADAKRRGKGGFVWVEPATNPNPLAPAIVKAADTLGIPAFDDHNGAMMEGEGGAAISNLCIRNGERANIPRGYLHAVMDQPNLTVLTGARMRRVKLAGKRATGVEVSWKGRVWEVRAGREVILSMGAIQTPHVLMLSGIGDRSELNRVGIDVNHHLPGVGMSFQDHPLLAACVWEPNEPLPPRNNSTEALYFWKSDRSLPTPDLQSCLTEVPSVNEITGPQFKPAASCWSIAPGLVRPVSRGHLRLRSDHPDDPIAVFANLMQDPADMAAMMRGVELAREIGNSAAMKDFVKREVGPGPVKGAELENFIRNATTSFCHASCTCPMGHDDMAVVDNELRVRGLTNLRIADASIMPDITTGNTMAPSVIIGERMAEILAAR